MDKNWISLNLDLLERDKESIDSDIKSLYPLRTWVNMTNVLCIVDVSEEKRLVLRLSNGTSYNVKEAEEIQAIQKWIDARTFE